MSDRLEAATGRPARHPDRLRPWRPAAARALRRVIRRAPFATLAICILLTGCTSASRLPVDTQPLRLESVPFHPQQRYQCGPAALATVLGASGVEVTPEALVPEVWIPERRGALAIELAAAARRHGRIAWTLEPSLDALLAELRAGRPVLVFQNLGVAAFPAWHFAVVVGVDPAAGEVLLRSGRERQRRTPVALFDRTWARAERWAMVVLGPGEMPARPERQRWIEAIAAVESLGHDRLAHAAWAGWLEDHPGDRVARFGRAVTAAAIGDTKAAEADYRRLLASDPQDIPALNNLAELLGRRGCRTVALALLDRAEGLTEERAEPAEVRRILALTRDALPAAGAAATGGSVAERTATATGQTSPDGDACPAADLRSW